MVLQTIRERLTGIVAIIILALLAIPFAFVGINSYFQSSSTNLVALVNDQEITFNEFNQSFMNYRRQAQAYLGDAFDPTQFDGPVARREHLDRMIDEALMKQAAEKLGLAVDDDTLAERIRSIPAFQVDGEFNTDLYESRVQGQGMTPSQFEKNLRASMVLDQLPGALGDSSFATRSETDQFVSLQQQKRTFDAVVVPTDPDAIDTNFSDEDVQAWYDEHKQEFRTKEQVVIEYIELNADELKTDEEPDDATLRAKYEEQKARFITPEQRLVSHILIQVAPDADEATRETAKQEAQELADRARKGEDFAALAKQYSDDAGSAEKGGDLGWVGPGLMTESFEDAMYKLTREHPISDPVQTGFGWHVIELRDIRPATGQTFEEARPALLEEARSEAAERKYLEIADRLVDVVYEDPTTLEAAALDTGLPIKTAGPFSRDGGEGIAANTDVVDAAFSDLVLLQGSVSDPIDLGPNHMVMLRDKEHIPAAVQPLEDVRDQVITGLRQQRAGKAAKARADELLAALNGGQSLADLTADSGLQVQNVVDALRSTDVPDHDVVQHVFTLASPAEGKTVNAVVPASNGYAVVSLSAVKAGELAKDSPLGREQYRRQIANSSASYEAWALRRELRDAADIKVFEENLGVAR